MLGLAIPGIIKGGLGLAQLFKGGAMTPERPEYETPDEVKEALANARRMERGRMPGIERAEERVRQGEASSAYGLRRGARTSGQLLSGLAGIRAQAKIAERGLLEAEAGDYYRRLGNLQQSLGLMAQYKDKEFQMNEMDPYLDEARTKAALTQSGLINLFSGAGDVVQGGIQGRMLDKLGAGGSKSFADWTTSMFGQNPFEQRDYSKDD